MFVHPTPNVGPSRSFPLAQAGRALARSPRVAMLCVAIVSLAASAMLALLRWPQPDIHDEFSYLLAGDTFASGRLGNPPHPLGEFFESFHILQQPTYASKYPPGQGLALALGQRLAGNPLVGVWLSMAAAAAGLVWMLAGWTPGRWALFGGLMFALHANIQFAWGHGYWGGAVAFLGGALLFGALPRLNKQPRVGDALILAAGATLLAISRPYEGAIACAGVGVALLARRIHSHQVSWARFFTRCVLPAGAALAVSAGAIGYYNRAVTGSPLQLPYATHEATYGSSPLFVWQAAKPLPEYSHWSLRAFHAGWGLDAWRQHQSLAGFAQAKLDGVARLWAFYFGALLTLPLLLAPGVFRDRRLRFALTMLAVLLFASCLVFWMLPHYFAPAAPLLFLTLTQAVRHARAATRRGWPAARHAPVGLLALQLVLLLIGAFQMATDDNTTWAEERAELARQLAELPGQHLVLVRYGADHNPHQDWVYNRADLERAQTLWARSRGGADDRPLVEHFANRRIWLLDADAQPRRLVPYDFQATPPRGETLPQTASASDPFADEAE